jgi:hypothetical protein
VWREFPGGPSGLFLKRGRDVIEAGTMLRPPFVWSTTQPDPDQRRFFFGKSFIYSAFAAPFVKVFGTNGFLFFHALLLGLTVWCAYLFLSARMPAATAALLAGAFVMASIVPVYFVWISPELFNFSLGVFAYFCWLYKEVAPAPEAPRRRRWILGGSTDLVAAVLIGIVTFSKVTNAFLMPPIVLWQLWQRRWARAVATSILFLLTTGALFGTNVAITGEWNYQGGERRTYHYEFPFQTEKSTFEVGLPMGRDEALTGTLFDRSVFWTNLMNNVLWYFVGRYSGLVAYFFPAVFALIAFVASPRGRPPWQYLVLFGAVAQILLFVISLPYTWMGGGGSIGNRYFLGFYAMFLFLMPPIRSVWLALVPWAIGALFIAKLVLNPFVTSFYPGRYADHGPLRLLPVELSNVNDLPIMTDASRVRVWFGDTELKDPGFQIYFLDDKAYQREEDKSFWVKGQSRTEILIKTDRPMRQLVFTLTAGPLETHVEAGVSGRTQEVTLQPGASQQIAFALDEGFPYQGRLVWVASLSSSSGFVPIFHGPSTDTRFLGVRVRPALVE